MLLLPLGKEEHKRESCIVVPVITWLLADNVITADAPLPHFVVIVGWIIGLLWCEEELVGLKQINSFWWHRH